MDLHRSPRATRSEDIECPSSPVPTQPRALPRQSTRISRERGESPAPEDPTSPKRSTYSKVTLRINVTDHSTGPSNVPSSPYSSLMSALDTTLPMIQSIAEDHASFERQNQIVTASLIILSNICQNYLACRPCECLPVSLPRRHIPTALSAPPRCTTRCDPRLSPRPAHEERRCTPIKSIQTSGRRPRSPETLDVVRPVDQSAESAPVAQFGRAPLEEQSRPSVAQVRSGYYCACVGVVITDIRPPRSRHWCPRPVDPGGAYPHGRIQ